MDQISMCPKYNFRYVFRSVHLVSLHKIDILFKFDILLPTKIFLII